MRCSTARRFQLERSLGRALPGPHVEELERHLRACAACAAARVSDERLAHELARLRTELPFELDVTARVLARLPERAPARSAVSLPAVGSLLAATAAMASLLIASVLQGAPALRLGVRRAGAAADALLSTGSSLLRPARDVLAACGEVLLGAWNGALPVLHLLARCAPSYRTAALTALLVMTLTTILAVRRDLQRRGPPALEEESLT